MRIKIFECLPLLFLLLFCTGSQAKVTHFDFQPMARLNKIEVGLNKGELFGFGQLRGSFKSMAGDINFIVEHPTRSTGRVLLDARALQFGLNKVNLDAHEEDWMHSRLYPEISFILLGLDNCRWEKRVLRARAQGSLLLKGVSKKIYLPVSIQYLRGARRKYDGKRGDLLLLEGQLPLSRTDFEISPGHMFDVIKDQITVNFSLIGCSDRCRPLLPSALFY